MEVPVEAVEQAFSHWEKMELQELSGECDEELEILLFIQDSIGLMYVNHDLAFSFRMYNEKGKSAGLFVENGNLRVSEIRYAEE